MTSINHKGWGERATVLRLVAALMFLLSFVVGCSVDAGNERTGRVSQRLAAVATDANAYSAGETITVTWDGLPGNARDWVAIATAGSADTAFVSYVYTNGQTAGSAPFTVNFSGSFVARAFENDGYTKLAESPEFTVTAPPATLTANKSAYVQSESANLSWTGGSGSPNDWVAIAPQGSPLTTYSVWTYTGGAAVGNINLSLAGLSDGEYVGRFFHNNSFVLAAETTAFHVGGATVATDKTQYTPGEDVVVTFNGFAGNAQDWIAIAKAGSPNTGYVAWTYTNGETSGTRTFSGLPVGNYVARAFFNNSFTLEKESAPFQVGTPVPATLTTDKSAYSTAETAIVTLAGGPGNAKDWIAIAAVGSPDSSFVTFQYTGATASGDFNFPLTSVAPGTYEARLFENDGYTKLATSASFTVGGGTTTTTLSRDKDAYGPSETVNVSFAGTPGGYYDWISIAPEGSTAQQYVTFQYIPFGTTSGTLHFSNLPSGTYVARLHYADGYDIQKETAPFTVTAATATVSTSAPTYDAGAPITVNFANMSGSATDWIALAEAGSPNTSFVSYKYTGGGASGQLVFDGLPAGTYVARAFTNNTYDLAATSAEFTVVPVGP